MLESHEIRLLASALYCRNAVLQVYIPYSDSPSKSSGRQPRHAALMKEVLDRALSLHWGQYPQATFRGGFAHAVNDYLAAGTFFDWMAGVQGVPFSHAVELYGEEEAPSQHERCFDLFNPPSAQLAEAVDISETMLVSLAPGDDVSLKSARLR